MLMSDELQYYPEFFDPKDLHDAKDIILGVNGMTLEERWEKETEWMRDALKSFRNFNKDSVVLDFGTGIGRLAKMIIEEFDCTVYGCDISRGMLDYSVEYVGSDKYHPIFFNELPNYKNFFTNITAAWVLQHIPDSESAIRQLVECSRPKSYMFVTDLKFKSVPCLKDNSLIWGVDQNTSNRAILEKYYVPLTLGVLPESVFEGNTDNVVNNAWWGNLQLAN